MNQRSSAGVHLLIVTADGRHSLGLVVPRALLHTTLAVAVLGTVGVTSLVMDDIALRHSPADTLTLEEGEAVRAPAPGAVVFSGGRRDDGLTVIVEHDADVRTLYAHLSQVSVRRGDHVMRGQVLGRSANTGRSTGAHLHYEVLVSGRAVDPRPFLGVTP